MSKAPAHDEVWGWADLALIGAVCIALSMANHSYTHLNKGSIDAATQAASVPSSEGQILIYTSFADVGNGEQAERPERVLPPQMGCSDRRAGGDTCPLLQGVACMHAK